MYMCTWAHTCMHVARGFLYTSLHVNFILKGIKSHWRISRNLTCKWKQIQRKQKYYIWHWWVNGQERERRAGIGITPTHLVRATRWCPSLNRNSVGNSFERRNCGLCSESVKFVGPWAYLWKLSGKPIDTQSGAQREISAADLAQKVFSTEMIFVLMGVDEIT